MQTALQKERLTVLDLPASSGISHDHLLCLVEHISDFFFLSAAKQTAHPQHMQQHTSCAVSPT